jgi:hypothetical protein
MLDRVTNMASIIRPTWAPRMLLDKRSIVLKSGEVRMLFSKTRYSTPTDTIRAPPNDLCTEVLGCHKIEFEREVCTNIILLFSTLTAGSRVKMLMD